MKMQDCKVETFMPSPKPGVGVNASSDYARLDENVLLSSHSWMSKSDTADIAYFRRSTDNGKTWGTPSVFPTKFDAKGGVGRRHPRAGYLDANSGRYIHIWTEGVLPNDNPLQGMQQWFLVYSVSEDGGKTIAVSEQIVQEGAEFDAQHPIPDVFIGKNCLMIGDLACRPLSLPDGSILVPCQSSVIGPDGNYWNPGGGHTYTDALTLRGTWKPDGRLAWQASKRVCGDPKRSTRGLIEPTIARLADGRILMVMRGSNDKATDLPAYKWMSFSNDSGRSWSLPVPWTFTDGTPFFSPSACSQLVCHSSGRLFWIGNISEHNAKGNSPRYPIVVGEVALDSGLLIRDTLREIDDRRDGESSRLTLSNFYAREDRATGELLLHLTRLFAKAFDPNITDFTANAMLCRFSPGN